AGGGAGFGANTAPRTSTAASPTPSTTNGSAFSLADFPGGVGGRSSSALPTGAASYGRALPSGEGGAAGCCSPHFGHLPPAAERTVPHRTQLSGTIGCIHPPGSRRALRVAESLRRVRQSCSAGGQASRRLLRGARGPRPTPRAPALRRDPLPYPGRRLSGGGT